MINAREPRTHCIRCGECCMRSSPTLHKEDLGIVRGGFLKESDLYTIRAGEVVRDVVRNSLGVADGDILKVKEKEDGGGCLFYDDDNKACRIYEHRPSQCRVLSCWDTAPFMEVFQKPKAARNDLIQDAVLLGLIQAHEERCSYSVLEDWVRRIEEESKPALDAILEILKFDHEIRPFVSRKLGIPTENMDFVFGRPLTKTVSMFGLKVVEEDDGFLLTVL